MIERWKTFAADNYEVSDHGRVRRKTKGRGTYAGRPLKPVLMGMGYYVVSPVIDGKNVLMYIHQIVARKFIGDRPAHQEVNHKDGDKLNNTSMNLEYVSHRENMRHARGLGLISDRMTYPQSTVDQVRQLAADGFTHTEIASITGISRRHCADIANNKSRKVLQCPSQNK